MAHLRSRRRTALIVPLGLALAASVGFVPGAATAAPNESPAPVSAKAAEDAPVFAYVVNTRTDRKTLAY
ncbi:peptidase S8, partial [Streptomyces sp. SID337]|nr:peptidase S8 [Streptomyces sp. SID337]